jgi:outer membrane protein, heavy metal efflux system
MKIFASLVIGSATIGTLLAETHLPETNIMPVTPAFINALADEALTNNPALKSADARVNAARSNEKTVPTWEDPMMRLGVMPAERSMRAEDGDLIYGIEQPLPLFGKPKAARRVAESETKVEQANAEFQFQQLRKEIAQAVFKTALANRALEIGEQDLIWIDALLAATEHRYEVGGATQLDVLRLQNERSKRAEQLKTDTQMLRHERVNLNRLLNRDFDSPWPLLQLPPVATPIVYSERLTTLATKNEPKLKAMRQQIDQATAMTDLTRRERYPSFNAGAEVRNYTGNGEFRQSMVTLSFNIPWGNRKKYDAAIQRDQAKKQALELDAADYELAIRNEIHQLTVKIDTARREALLYRDQILPRSETALKSAYAAWESNAGMFRDVLEARRMLLDAQLMHARAISEQYQMLSELVLCCGLGDLEALQMIGAQLGNEDPQPKK